MNRVIVLSLMAGLSFVLIMANVMPRAPRSRSLATPEGSRQLTVSMPENKEPNPSENHETLGDTPNTRVGRNFSEDRKHRSLKVSLKRVPHKSSQSEDSGTVREPDSPINMDTKIKNTFRKNRFQFRTLSDERVNFSLIDLDGNTHSLANHRGEWVLINFWASWCPPCREEMPSLQRLYRTLQDNHFTILAINLRESRQKAGSFSEEFGLTFPILLDRDGAIASDYGIFTIPTTWIINPRGKPVARLLGPLDWTKPKIVRAFERLSSITGDPDPQEE